jgi:hypothetical protein
MNRTRGIPISGPQSELCRTGNNRLNRRKDMQMVLTRRWLLRRPAPRFVRHVG